MASQSPFQGRYTEFTTDSKQSEINTGGKLNISAGGKTLKAGTKVKATKGEYIKAGGGTIQ